MTREWQATDCTTSFGRQDLGIVVAVVAAVDNTAGQPNRHNTEKTSREGEKGEECQKPRSRARTARKKAKGTNDRFCKLSVKRKHVPLIELRSQGHLLDKSDLQTQVS